MTRKEESPAVETRESPGGATETIARHPSRGIPAQSLGARMTDGPRHGIDSIPGAFMLNAA